MKKAINIIIYVILCALFTLALYVLIYRHQFIIEHGLQKEALDMSIYNLTFVVYAGVAMLINFFLSLFVPIKTESKFNTKCQIFFRVQMAILACYIVVFQYIVYNYIAMVAIGTLLILAILIFDIRLIINRKKQLVISDNETLA